MSERLAPRYAKSMDGVRATREKGPENFVCAALSDADWSELACVAGVPADQEVSERRPTGVGRRHC